MRPAAEKFRRWREHPSVFVREEFKVEPDAWQEEALEAFPHNPRMAMRACKGPGKTATLAWIGWNFLLTLPHSVVGATSISGANLRTALWTELARWRERSELLKSMFEMNRSEIFCREHPKTWKMEARTWAQDADAEQIGAALSGLHSEYVMWLLDESGGYPEAILPTCEAIFSGNPKRAHIVQAGNPLLLSGPLYRACVTARALWKVITITGDPDDPKRSPRIGIEHAREQIAQYGRENAWVKVNIFGEFPEHSINALIGPNEIEAAEKRVVRESEIVNAARILGVDVARFGDDASVIFPRQGIVAFTPQIFRNIDGVQGAGHVARKWQDWQADACFVDNTGGWGASWIDQLRVLGRRPIPVDYAGRPYDPRYANKRAEMYFNLVDWIKGGARLPPDCPEIGQALTQITYTFRGDRMLLEDKAQLKARIGMSPDHADALCQTFAAPVVARPKNIIIFPGRRVKEYDPFESYLSERR